MAQRRGERERIRRGRGAGIVEAEEQAEEAMSTQPAWSSEAIVSHTVTKGQLGEVATAAAVQDAPVHAAAASGPATTKILGLILHLSLSFLAAAMYCL